MWQTIKSLFIQMIRRWLNVYSQHVLHRTRIESRATSASDVLKYAGTWAGGDLEDCLAEAIHSRAVSRF